MRQQPVAILIPITLGLTLGVGILQTLTPLYAMSLGASYAVIGFVMASFWVARSLAEIPSGLLSDKIGRKKPMLIGLVVIAASAYLFSITDVAYMLVVPRGLWGLGTSLFLASALALLTQRKDVGGRGTAVGMFQSMEMIGVLVGASLSGVLATLIGFNLTFFAYGALVTPFAIVAWRSTILDVKVPKKTIPVGRKLARAFITNRNLMLMNICVFITYFGVFGTVFFTIPLYAVDFLGLTAAHVGGLISARAIGMIVGAQIAGRFLDKFGSKLLLSLSFVVQSGAVFALTLTDSYAVLFFFVLLVGLGSGAFIVLFPVLAADLAPSAYTGAAIGFYRTFQNIGSTLAPIVLAVIAEMASLASTFHVVAGLLLLGVPIAIAVYSSPG